MVCWLNGMLVKWLIGLLVNWLLLLSLALQVCFKPVQRLLSALYCIDLAVQLINNFFGLENRSHGQQRFFSSFLERNRDSEIIVGTIARMPVRQQRRLLYFNVLDLIVKILSPPVHDEIPFLARLHRHGFGR